jgi:predicted dehydrogenase
MLKRILFIGLGGAGQRHLRLFKKNLDGKNVEFIAYRSTNKTPLLNPDFSINKDSTIESYYKVKTYNNLHKALDLKPNLVVISTPSSTHLKYAQVCAENGINILVEKPLSNSTYGVQKLIETIKKNRVALRVGLQRRFHAHIKRVKDIVVSGGIGKILNANFTVASFIPRWHPYEDFLQLYACRKELGGGVLLTEIHEIDLAIWFFGVPSSVSCVGGTYSNVGMDVEDTVRLILDYVNFSVQINLTFWQKHHERFFSISGENGYLSWNQDKDTLIEEYFNEPTKNLVNQNPTLDVDRMFDLQVQSVINNFNFTEEDRSINDSLIALKIVEAAKESMKTKRVIDLSELKYG